MRNLAKRNWNAMKVESQKFDFKECVLVSFIVVIVSLAVFSKYIFGDDLFIYSDANDDTYQAFLCLYQMVVNQIKHGGLHLMNFTVGLGTNILSSQSAIFDPFALILYVVGLIFGVEKIAYALVYMQIFKMICGALACGYFLSFFQITKKSRMVGSILYAFSSFFVGQIGQHYMFSTAAILVVFAFALLERGIRDSRKLPAFTIIVSICAIWAVYFCYMILLACGVYAIYRWTLTENKSVKGGIVYFGKLFFSVILGIFLGAFIFIPTSLVMLTTSNRITGAVDKIQLVKNLFVLLPKEQIKSLILRLFSNQLQGGINNWSGYQTSFKAHNVYVSCISLISLLYFGIKNICEKNKRQIIFVGVIAFNCLFQVAGIIFNAFGDFETRFTFVLIPGIIYIICWYLDQFEINYDIKLGSSLCIVSILIVICGTDWNLKISYMSGIIAVCAIIVICFLQCNINKLNKRNLIYVFLATVLIASTALDTYLTINYERMPYTKSWYAQNGINKDMEETQDEIKADEEFYRVERNFLGYGIQQASTYSEVADYCGLSFYNSIVNSNLARFRTQVLGHMNIGMDANRATYAFGDMGLVFDKTLSDLYGLKYVLSDYMTRNNNWKLIESINDRYLYFNKSLKSAGLFYSNICTEDEYEQLSEYEKNVVLSYGVVLDNSYKDESNYKEIRKKVYKNRIINKLENCIETKVNSNQELEFSTVTEKTKENVNKMFIDFSVETDTIMNMTILCDTGFGYNEEYWTRKDFQIVPGENNKIVMQVPIDTNKIKIRFEQEASIKITDIDVIENYGYDYKTNIVDMGYNPQKAIFNVTIDASEDGIVVLPICKENGWRAELDGDYVKCEEADYAFMAFHVNKGKHFLTLYYKTPGLEIGLDVTIISVIIFCVWLFVLCKYKSHYKDIEKYRKR